MPIEHRDAIREAMPGLFELAPPPWDEQGIDASQWVLIPIDHPDSAHLTEFDQSDAWWVDQPNWSSDSIAFPDQILTWESDLGFTDGTHIPGQLPNSASRAGQPWHAPMLPPTPDAFAFYLPFHRYSESDWGIYLSPEGVRHFAVTLWAQSSGRLDRPYCLVLARLLMYLHEFFHHIVESFATRLEVDRRVPLYNDAFECVFREQFARADIDEEALANAYALRRIADIIGRKKWPKQVQSLAMEQLTKLVAAMPYGYGRGASLQEDTAFYRARGEFAETNHARYTKMARMHPAVWRNADHMFRGLENVVTHACYIVPLHGWFSDRFKAHVRFFRLADLKRVLLDHGASFDREGGSHEIWRTADGRTVTIPRHREIAEGTARAIARAAGLGMSLTQLRSYAR